ncbi:unnamed protein product [Alopecurus aequalis]
MALTMNKAMPTFLLALLLVASAALLPCHATGRDIGIDIYPIGKYCVGEADCQNPTAWAYNNCRVFCLQSTFIAEKSTCGGGKCCCYK